jgi:hypothetical protein
MEPAASCCSIGTLAEPIIIQRVETYPFDTANSAMNNRGHTSVSNQTGQLGWKSSSRLQNMNKGMKTTRDMDAIRSDRGVLSKAHFPASVRPVKSNRLKFRNEIGTHNFVKNKLVDADVEAMWTLSEGKSMRVTKKTPNTAQADGLISV